MNKYLPIAQRHNSVGQWPLVRAFVVVLLVFISMVTGPAAWSRGGGGGGGHGGGFGGGGFGGYHGGYSYGGGYSGYRSYGYGYGPYYGSSYDRSVDRFFTFLFIIAVILCSVYPLLSSVNQRKTLIVVTMILTRGQEYTKILNRFTTQAQFDTPLERTMSAHEVVHMIRDSEVFLGSYRHLGSSFDPNELGMAAREIWQAEMSVGQIKADVVNVSAPGQKMRANFGKPVFDPEATAVGDEGYCLVSIIASATGFWPSSSTDRSTVVNVLHRLGSASIDSLYFYFTPSAGTAFSRNTAINLLEQLRGSL